MRTLSQQSVSGASDATNRASFACPELEFLENTFGQKLTVYDGQTGELIRVANGPAGCNWWAWQEVCREVARREEAELLEEESPLALWAVPLLGSEPRVAAGVFITRAIVPGEDLRRATRVFGLDPVAMTHWATRQYPWSIAALQGASRSILTAMRSQRQVERLERESRDLSIHLAATYEEISLLHRLSQNLKISKSDEDLGRLTLEWMVDVVPAEGFAIQLHPILDADEISGHPLRRAPVFLTQGHCPIDRDRFAELMGHVNRGKSNQPIVVNPPISLEGDWPCPEVRELMAVPLAEGENYFGWLAAFNHVGGGEFGTVEASLLGSVAAILGIHSGNISLYRQQSELMAGIIRALTAAIDAKDQYTCGHSDRVARIAVRLAEELALDDKVVNQIYLAGLLHDIGKIGVSDSVLRKPGKLSDEEYEHIKRHTEIGHRILRDLKKLDNLLPVILHHHEAWDGGGYPAHLRCEEIPLAARIVAVADSYDAMASDRPYRKGMPDEKIDTILRAGAGHQWDARVVEAFFAARHDIRLIIAAQPNEEATESASHSQVN